MIKETKYLKEAIERHKFCDCCLKEIMIGLACSVAKCEYCKKDLCENCIGHEDNSGGDYRIVYCKQCWEIGEKYRSEIKQLDNKIEALYEQWVNECQEKS